MTRTISRRLPHRAPIGETTAICDYCGVQWYRSKCRRDAAGLLACPKDQRGRDTVTLAKGNAKAAAKLRYRTPEAPRGRKDSAGEQYRTTPESILGSLLVGWWKPSGVVTGTVDSDYVGQTEVEGQNYDVGAWRSEVARYAPRVVSADETDSAVASKEMMADLSGPGTLVAVENSSNQSNRPTLDMSAVRSTDGTRPTGTHPTIRFDADSQMLAHGGPLLRGAVASTGGDWIGSNPCFWFVASRTDTSLLLPQIKLQGQNAFVRVLSLLHDSDDVAEATSWYAGAGLINLSSDFTPDDALRLYSVRMETDQLVLKVSDTEWTKSTGVSYSAGAVAATVRMHVGRQAVEGVEGHLNEIVLTQGVPTAAQIADLEAYFLRAYPDLETTI